MSGWTEAFLDDDGSSGLLRNVEVVRGRVGHAHLLSRARWAGFLGGFLAACGFQALDAGDVAHDPLPFVRLGGQAVMEWQLAQ